MKSKVVEGFKIIDIRLDGYMYRNKTTGLVVIQSEGKEQDGKMWLHTSYSRASRIPTYQDTVFIKRYFIGRDMKAIMIFPKEVEYINIHPFCLHLWTCLEDDILPDFTLGSGSI